MLTNFKVSTKATDNRSGKIQSTGFHAEKDHQKLSIFCRICLKVTKYTLLRMVTVTVTQLRNTSKLIKCKTNDFGGNKKLIGFFNVHFFGRSIYGTIKVLQISMCVQYHVITVEFCSTFTSTTSCILIQIVFNLSLSSKGNHFQNAVKFSVQKQIEREFVQQNTPFRWNGE